MSPMASVALLTPPNLCFMRKEPGIVIPCVNNKNTRPIKLAYHANIKASRKSVKIYRHKRLNIYVPVDFR